MMMIVPINYEVDKTQKVTKEDRSQLSEIRKFMSSWGAKTKHHDCDDDGEYSITKRFKAIWWDGAGSLIHKMQLTFLSKSGE